MIFAALVIERTPLDWDGFFGALGRWFGDAGLYAFVWLALMGIGYAFVGDFRQRVPWSSLHTIMAVLGGLAAVAYAAFVVVIAVKPGADEASAKKPTALAQEARAAPDEGPHKVLFNIAGMAALAACCMPILRDLGLRRIVFRRIWAIARVSVKEAWSRGIVWACLLIPVIYLFADWFLTAKPENQLRARIAIAYFSMAILFVISAALLGAFGISTDIKNQNIFTILTKPVERFEIVLGRFLGYALLLFAELAVLAVVSYIFVVRGLTEQAVHESFHARVPLYGAKLSYYNTGPVPGEYHLGENVGREWAYRSYIGVAHRESKNQGVQFAVWDFDELPSALVNRPDDDAVPLEFSFDIFRTSKGQEGKDIYCTFTFARGDLPLDELEKLQGGLLNKEYERLYAEALQRNRVNSKPGDELDQINANSRKEAYWKLFEKHGMWQLKGIGVTDYHTQAEEIPAKVFKTLRGFSQSSVANAGPGKSPVMRILVNVENDDSSREQRVGVARPDLYLLVEDRPFLINFFKGAVCIYLIACVVLGVAVACSSFLNGIVSLLVTAASFMGGLFLPFIQSVAGELLGTMGPFESGYRLGQRQTAALPLDKQSALVGLIEFMDSIVRVWFRFIMNCLPNVGEFYPTNYVANGFDITWGPLLVLNRLLPVCGYLIPWAILAYYCIKSREVANP